MSKIKLYLNPAILSSKAAGGYPLHTFVRAVNADCGLECTPSCPDGDCLPTTNRSSKVPKARQNATQAQLFAVLQVLTDRIEQLEARLAAFEPVAAGGAEESEDQLT